MDFDSIKMETSVEEINFLIDMSDAPSILYLYSDDCSGCNKVKPEIVATFKKFGQEYRFVRINASLVPDVWDAFGIESIPTVLIVGGGEALTECTGHLTREKIAEALANATSHLRSLEL